MRKIILLLILAIYSISVNAQSPLTSLMEDFNGSCASVSGFPSHWLNINPLSSTIPEGTWTCAPTNGRWGTSGIKCTGVWGSPSQYHLDTSYLISPELNLSAETGHIYLAFDTKTSNINLGARLYLRAGTDSLFGTAVADSIDLTPAMLPVFSQGDSSDWVTHEVDLTPYKYYAPLYVAFMYVSTTTQGSTWYLDNIHTTIFASHAPDMVKNAVPALTVIGNSTRTQITLSYKAESQGQYRITVFDVVGHKVYEEDVNTRNGNTYTLTGLNLHSGMYIVKMGNGLINSTAKTFVP